MVYELGEKLRVEAMILARCYFFLFEFLVHFYFLQTPPYHRKKKGSRRRLLRFYVYLVDTLVLVLLLRTRGAQLERMQVAIMELRNVKWEGAGGEAIKFN